MMGVDSTRSKIKMVNNVTVKNNNFTFVQKLEREAGVWISARLSESNRDGNKMQLFEFISFLAYSNLTT